MTYSAARSAFITFLKANYSSTAVDWENSPGGEPALPFLKPTIIDAISDDHTLGYESISRVGIFDLTLVCAESSGTLAANTLADILVAMFKNITLSDGTRTGLPYKTFVEKSNGRYIISTTVPFERVEN